MLLMEALKHPRCKVLYIGLSKTSAENAMWTHTIEEICLHYGIEYKYSKHTKTVLFTNGSIIRLTGADASPQEMHKLLGGKYRICAIDECQSHTQDLKELVNGGIGPAVADYINDGGGIIVMAGTPGNQMGFGEGDSYEEHYWYATTKKVPKAKGVYQDGGWSVHHWEPQDNPHMVEEVKAQFADFEARMGPRYIETTWFRQQWLCEWVVDDKLTVYKFDPTKNVLLERLPPEERQKPDAARTYQLQKELKILSALKDRSTDYTYLMGIDLGWEDACAWVVGAYSRYDMNFYVVESFSQNHTVVDTIANITKELQTKYNVKSTVIDAGGGGKLIVESMRIQYNLHLKAAEKTGKESIIAAMNSDFITENIKVVGGANQHLQKEWSALLVDEKAKKRGEFKEADKFKNHLCDAALYCFRESRHYRGKAAPVVEPNNLLDEMLKRKARSKPFHMDMFERMDDEDENREIVRKFNNDKE